MKKMRFFILTMGILVACGSVALGADPVKIAFVDMQRALNFCEAGKEAKKQMTQEVEKLQKTMAAKQKEVEKIKEDLEKRGTVLSESVRKDKERDYQMKLRDLQRMQKDYEDDLRRKDRELTEGILRKLEAIIKKMGEEGKYTMILERNQGAMIYTSSTVDLTEEVIKIINQSPK